MDFMLENCKTTWREEAQERALQDLKAEGLTGEAAKARLQELVAKHYAELERIGLEGIK
jgi:hypothetical protein